MQTQAKVALVTGAFGVLGRATGLAFVEAGWRVVYVDRVPEARGAPLPVGSLVLGDVDLAEPPAAQRAVAAAATAFGRLDALVNVAGGFAWQTLADGEVDTWDRMYRINLRTAVVATQAALPALLAAGDGRIVNVGAGAAAKSAAGMGAYTASKAGVQRLTEALSAELKDRGVNVNCVLPGTIDTPANRADMPDADRTRWVQPSDLADVIVFLCSPAARAVTGAAIPVTGRG